MSPLSPEVFSSRTIREAILLMLNAAFRGDPEFGVVPHGRILADFDTGRTRYTPAQIDVDLRVLVADELVERVPCDGGPDRPRHVGVHRDLDPPAGEAGRVPLPDKVYRITSPGRDFVRGKFPWHRIDEYTGGQRP